MIGLSGEAGACDAGKARLECKGCIVQDGDVMHFPLRDPSSPRAQAPSCR